MNITTVKYIYTKSKAYVLAVHKLKSVLQSLHKRRNAFCKITKKCVTERKLND